MKYVSTNALEALGSMQSPCVSNAAIQRVRAMQPLSMPLVSRGEWEVRDGHPAIDAGAGRQGAVQ